MPSGKAKVLTRRLVTHSGKIVSVYPDSFNLKVKKKIYSTISYNDVLELSVDDQHVSIVPEETTKSHGAWEDIGRVFPGTRIAIVLDDGKTIKGFANSSTASSLVIVDDDGRERIDIPRNRVVAFYGLIGGYGGVKKGASKGVEGSTNRSDQLLTGVFAGVGALAGLVKSDGRPILIYSK